MTSIASSRRAPSVLVMLATALLVLPVTGAAADEPDRQISVLTTGTQEIGAFEPFFVEHGWQLPHWECKDGDPTEATQEDLDAEYPSFRLYVNGVLQEAELIAECFVVDGGERAGKFYRTVFADGLRAGTYTFLGEWWDADQSLFTSSETTLHVKPGAAPFMPPGLLDERPSGPPEGVPPTRP